MNDIPSMDAAKGIHFHCVYCGADVPARPEADYSVCPCPKCRRLTPVPPEAEFSCQMPNFQLYPREIYSVDIKFPCPKCGARLDVDARNAGVPGFCPACNDEIECPHIPAFLFRSPPGNGAPPSVKSKNGPTVIHLTREEIDFLNPPGASKEKAALHAT